jgi:short-subunit dehydrogenase
MYSRRAGTVINMCSIAGWIAPPLYAVYGAAKFGVRGFTEALRREAPGYDVSVCIVYPSTAATDFGSHIGTSRAKQHFRMPSRLQLSGEQVARSVVSLARRPRRELVIPWWMLISMFLNSHLGTLSDRAQGSAVHPYHEL